MKKIRTIPAHAEVVFYDAENDIHIFRAQPFNFDPTAPQIDATALLSAPCVYAEGMDSLVPGRFEGKVFVSPVSPHELITEICVMRFDVEIVVRDGAVTDLVTTQANVGGESACESGSAQHPERWIDDVRDVVALCEQERGDEADALWSERQDRD